MIFDDGLFAFTQRLERDWRAIRDEVSALENHHRERYLAWPEREIYNEGWEVFGLYAFGSRIDDQCALCPATAEAIGAVSGLTTAGFSRLAPGTWIRPHRGYSHSVLRCHLGLSVGSNCGLRVGAETASWEPGRCLVFDDTVEHEAWNDGPEPRIVLLIDFERPAALGAPTY